MSDYLERVEAFRDAWSAERMGSAVAFVERYGSGQRYALRAEDLRALLADAKQLRAQATEYGIDATFASTRSVTFTVADNLGDALEALAEFDARHGDVACRQLVERQVGEWRKVGDVR